MALCIECSPAVQEVPGSIPDWDASVSDALCRAYRWPWSSPYIVVTPTWCNSHTVLRFERPAPSHATEVRVPFSLSCSSDLHASDQIYPRPSQTQPRSPIKSLRYRGLGGSCGRFRIAVNNATRMALCIDSWLRRFGLGCSMQSM
jgi:hypothetical protein